jgi:hypothetical protein
VSTFALATICRTGREAGVALAADHLVAVELAGQGLEGGLDEAAGQGEDEVHGGLLLDVVVEQGAAVLELLAAEEEALLPRGDALLRFDQSLDILDRVRRRDVESHRSVGSKEAGGGSVLGRRDPGGRGAAECCSQLTSASGSGKFVNNSSYKCP